MKNMKIPTRPAPSVEEARLRNNNKNSQINALYEKKKAPPRPPPPDLTKIRSKSAWNLITDNTPSLIDWSPPSSPKNKHHGFAGSVSSSFSSSTSSLASSKKSFEYETVPINQNPWNNNVPFPFPNYGLQAKSNTQQQQLSVPPKSVPTIIRPQPPKKKGDSSRGDSPISRESSPFPPSTSRGVSPIFITSPPMPNIPPPSPPKDATDSKISPFGIALYNYEATQPGDLPLQVDDIVYILRRINNEWLYGKVDDMEGMFPANFIDIQVPLEDEDGLVTALYNFQPQTAEDLELISGHKVKVLRRISRDWLYGESNGKQGQFPVNFIDRIPNNV